MSDGRRRSLLFAALGFDLLDSYAPELQLIHSWRHRRDAPPGEYDIQLTQYNERSWRATFYVTGMGGRAEIESFGSGTAVSVDVESMSHSGDPSKRRRHALPRRS